MKVSNLLIIYHSFLKEIEELNELKRSILNGRSYSEQLNSLIDNEKQKLEEKCNSILNLKIDVHLVEKNLSEASTEESEPISTAPIHTQIIQPIQEEPVPIPIHKIQPSSEKQKQSIIKKTQKVYRY